MGDFKGIHICTISCSYTLYYIFKSGLFTETIWNVFKVSFLWNGEIVAIMSWGAGFFRQHIKDVGKSQGQGAGYFWWSMGCCTVRGMIFGEVAGEIFIKCPSFLPNFMTASTGSGLSSSHFNKSQRSAASVTKPLGGVHQKGRADRHISKPWRSTSTRAMCLGMRHRQETCGLGLVWVVQRHRRAIFNRPRPAK